MLQCKKGIIIIINPPLNIVSLPVAATMVTGKAPNLLDWSGAHHHLQSNGTMARFVPCRFHAVEYSDRMANVFKEEPCLQDQKAGKLARRMLL
jgi:hypothetical protein